MSLILTIAAVVFAMAAISAFGKYLQGLVVSLCILLALILAIQTVGCESFSERRQKRIDDRRQRFDKWRQDRRKETTPEPTPIDDEKRERRFKFLRDGYYEFD